jgi:hypothetical protein
LIGKASFLDLDRIPVYNPNDKEKHIFRSTSLKVDPFLPQFKRGGLLGRPDERKKRYSRSGACLHSQKRRFGLSTGIFGGMTVRVRHG